MKTALRVLIVEDSADDAELVLRELRQRDYEPSFHRVDTSEAMAAALGKQAWDIVLADYALPQFSALAALAQMQSRGLDLPFIIVSGVIGEEAAVAAMKLGAHDYVKKDNLARLGPAVQRELREAEERRFRRQAEAALQRSEARLRAVMDNVSDGILTLDDGGVIQSINLAGQVLFGYLPGEPTGQDLRLLLAPPYGDEYEASLRQYLEGGKGEVIGSGPRQVLGRHKDGTTFPLDFAISEMRLGDQRHFICCLQGMNEKSRSANKRMETCPWCNKRAWVDPRHVRTYRCSSCGKNFTFTPDANSPGFLFGEAWARGEASRAQRSLAPVAPASPPPEFVETPFLKDLVARALGYLKDRRAVHLCGPEGCGKTTLALHLAHLLGRPTVLIQGGERVNASDLVGRESGLQRTFPGGQTFPAALKGREEAGPSAIAGVLAEAWKVGYTVVHDEFTRSSVESNSALLSLLQERVLSMPGGFLPAHPNFRAIFTSNPGDYPSVHGGQDALLDRMVTIHLDKMDRHTEVAIARAHSALPAAEVERIVDLVRAYRSVGPRATIPSVRTCIMIARILKFRDGHAYDQDPIFIQTCRDILLSEAGRSGLSLIDIQQAEDSLTLVIPEVCSAPLA